MKYLIPYYGAFMLILDTDEKDYPKNSKMLGTILAQIIFFFIPCLLYADFQFEEATVYFFMLLLIACVTFLAMLIFFTR